MAKIKLIKMVRDHADEGGPTTADVHPDMVEEYEKGGWRQKGAKK